MMMLGRHQRQSNKAAFSSMCMCVLCSPAKVCPHLLSWGQDPGTCTGQASVLPLMDIPGLGFGPWLRLSHWHQSATIRATEKAGAEARIKLCGVGGGLIPHVLQTSWGWIGCLFSLRQSFQRTIRESKSSIQDDLWSIWDLPTLLKNIFTT